MKVLLYFLAFLVYTALGPCLFFPLSVLAATACFWGKDDEPPPRRARPIGIVFYFIVFVLEAFIPLYVFGRIVRYFDGPLSLAMFLIPVLGSIIFNDFRRVMAAREKGHELRATIGETLGASLAIICLGSMPIF